MARPKCGNVRKGWKKKELTLVDRRNIFFTSIQAELTGGIKRGFFKQLSSNLPVSARTCSAHWKELRQKYEENVRPVAATNLTTIMADLPNTFFSTSKKVCGQNRRVWEPELMSAAMKEVPRSLRQTLRNTATSIGVPTTSFNRLMKEQQVAVRHTSALKPILTEENKLARVLFCISRIEFPRSTRHGGNLKYKTCYDEITLDKKWFNLTYNGMTYYLAPDELPPVRRCKHKSYIDKIMFLSAIAHPRQLPDGTWWDGKLSIWPFGRHIPAARARKNRPKGTPIWTPESVCAEVYRAMLMNEVILALFDKWPGGDFRNANVKIRIQQDGAPSHINNNDETWQEYLEEMGLEEKISLYNQPANSPDLNHNDLGFFNALKKAYQRECPKDLDEIIKCVQRAYNNYPIIKLNRLWLTRQQVMNEIIDCGGDNDFKLPHMGKAKLERQGTLPEAIEVTDTYKNYL
jgi:hypothetical protein